MTEFYTRSHSPDCERPMPLTLIAERREPSGEARHRTTSWIELRGGKLSPQIVGFLGRSPTP